MTNKTVALKVEKRESLGKGGSRELRRNKKVPAIIYGGKDEPQSVTLDLNEFKTLYLKGWLTSRLVDLELDGKKIAVQPKDVQLDPITDLPIHVDFLRVDPNKPVRISVPVKCLNVERSPGIKRGGVLNVVRRSVEVMGVPAVIPEKIEIDLAGLSIGDSVHIKAIDLPEGVEPTIKRNFTIVTVAGRIKKDETLDDTAAPSAADVPVVGEEEGEDSEGSSESEDK